MKIVFLGTNGWFDTPCGNTICILIETSQAYLILDAGSGFYKLDDYIREEKPIYLFLSHFHLDHIYGLHTLTRFSFNQGLHIFGQSGTRLTLNTYVNFPYTVPFDQLPYPVRLHELPEEAGLLPFGVTTLPLIHASPCIGFRFEVDDKVITYCTDTGYCQNAVDLARNADLLITECAYTLGEVNHGWPHLDPHLAARIAIEAHARQLALVHFDANRYRHMQQRTLAGEQARQLFADTIASYDGAEIEL